MESTSSLASRLGSMFGGSVMKRMVIFVPLLLALLLIFVNPSIFDLSSDVRPMGNIAKPAFFPIPKRIPPAGNFMNAITLPFATKVVDLRLTQEKSTPPGTVLRLAESDSSQPKSVALVTSQEQSTQPTPKIETKTEAGAGDLGLGAPPMVANLLKRHAKLQEKVRSGKVPLRAMIVRCHVNDLCGGIGDRLFGLLTLFTAAVLTDRAFFVSHIKPLPLEEFIISNIADWRLNTVENATVKNKLQSCLEGKGCGYHNMMMPGPQCKQVMALVKSSKDPVLLANSNHRTECVLKILLDLNFLPQNGDRGFDRKSEDSLRLWASSFSHYGLNYLFKFSPSIIETGTSILKGSTLPVDLKSKETKECLICIHVRSGKNTNEPGNRHGNLAQFGECAHMVEEGMKKSKSCPRLPTWIVVSDHSEAPQLVGGNFAKPLSTSKLGPIIHIDRVGKGEHQRAGTTRLYVDFFVLTQCKYFVASLSTLSEIASIWHGTSVQRYDMALDHVCNSKPVNIHNWMRDANIPIQVWLNTIKHDK